MFHVREVDSATSKVLRSSSPHALVMSEAPPTRRVGTKLMELFAARDGKAMRDFLAPAEPEPMQTEPAPPLPSAAATLAAEQSALLAAMGGGEDMGFDLFD